MFADHSWQPLKNMRVLVIEDDPIIALDVAEILCSAGASVAGPFTNLETAIAAAHLGGLSAAILDVRIGNGTVDPVADILQSRSIPIIFYSGHGQEESLKKNWPGCRFLQKPASDECLLAAFLGL